MKRTRNFVHLPEYPGGKAAFGKYISENLVYPSEALLHKIEGVVYLSAEINDNGEILQIKIDKGIGYGCDEEAIRLLKNIRHGRVKNNGVRVKTFRKFTIPFKLPTQQIINYNYVNSKQKSEISQKEKKYSYQINTD